MCMCVCVCVCVCVDGYAKRTALGIRENSRGQEKRESKGENKIDFNQSNDWIDLSVFLSIYLSIYLSSNI